MSKEKTLVYIGEILVRNKAVIFNVPLLLLLKELLIILPNGLK
jgi:hypothetical protein